MKPRYRITNFPTFTPASSGSPTSTFLGITYTVQGSMDLSDFASPSTVVTPVPLASNPTPPAGYTYRTFSLNGSDGAPNRGFMRVTVTR